MYYLPLTDLQKKLDANPYYVEDLTSMDVIRDSQGCLIPCTHIKHYRSINKAILTEIKIYYYKIKTFYYNCTDYRLDYIKTGLALEKELSSVCEFIWVQPARAYLDSSIRSKRRTMTVYRFNSFKKFYRELAASNLSKLAKHEPIDSFTYMGSNKQLVRSNLKYLSKIYDLNLLNEELNRYVASYWIQVPKNHEVNLITHKYFQIMSSLCLCICPDDYLVLYPKLINTGLIGESDYRREDYFKLKERQLRWFLQ